MANPIKIYTQNSGREGGPQNLLIRLRSNLKCLLQTRPKHKPISASTGKYALSFFTTISNLALSTWRNLKHAQQACCLHTQCNSEVASRTRLCPWMEYLPQKNMKMAKNLNPPINDQASYTRLPVYKIINKEN
ncbi:hypothetical protein ANN_22704 [Periplaneta americana]|uniref:Uncharacterized protein n=1 Tax=Periplaneta americana TaxID=6978 RepID=A0ABQ8S956_PERAM|nr:hypothetical protein ANN_22704 [Periplaneta americana]